jgi:hypothetical protein
VGRLRHVATGQRHDLPGHRRREQHGLTARGRERHDALDVGQEAHVEHLVGLVEHEGLHVLEVEVALAGEVDEASGRADDDLDALLERVDLRLVRAAAVDAQDAYAADAAGLLQVARDLDAELAGRHHDERLRLPRTPSFCSAYAGSSGETSSAAAGCRSPASCRCRSWPGR